jgi:hypothetical protein
MYLSTVFIVDLINAISFCIKSDIFFTPAVVLYLSDSSDELIVSMCV